MIAGLSCVPVVDYCVWLPGDDRCIGTVTGRLHNLANSLEYWQLVWMQQLWCDDLVYHAQKWVICFSMFLV